MESKHASTQPVKHTQPQSFLDDPDCISMRESIENDPSAINDIDPADKQKLLAYLREYEIDRAMAEEYIEAKKAKQMVEEIKNSLSRSSRSRSALTPPNGKSCDNDRRAEFEQKHNEKLQQYNEETTTKRDYILKRHQQQLKRLEDHWTKEMPRKYRKPSNYLLQIKQREKSFAMTGDYDQAKGLHDQAEQLLQEEQRAAQQILRADYCKARENLVHKQAIELLNFDNTRNEGKKVIEAKHQLEMKSAMNRDAVMKQKQRESMTSHQNTRSSSSNYTIPISKAKSQPRETLLPPLIPPTDPKFDQEEEQRRKENIRVKRELARKREEEMKHRQEILAQYQQEKQQQRPKQQTFVTADEEMQLSQVSSTLQSNVHSSANLSAEPELNEDNGTIERSEDQEINDKTNIDEGEAKQPESEENKAEDKPEEGEEKKSSGLIGNFMNAANTLTDSAEEPKTGQEELKEVKKPGDEAKDGNLAECEQKEAAEPQAEVKELGEVETKGTKESEESKEGNPINEEKSNEVEKALPAETSQVVEAEPSKPEEEQKLPENEKVDDPKGNKEEAKESEVKPEDNKEEAKESEKLNEDKKEETKSAPGPAIESESPVSDVAPEQIGDAAPDEVAEKSPEETDNKSSPGLLQNMAEGAVKALSDAAD